MKQTHAVAYLRVSGRGQIDGDGFPRQREAVARFAKSKRLVIVQEFVEEGVSGTRELDDRPALAALIDRVASNGVRVVIVERADRLARDLLVGEVIIRELAKYGVKVLTADGQDLSADDGDPTRKLIRQVLGAVAEFEKTCLVLKLRAARTRQRRRDGRCEGVKPFGTFDGEAAVVARMKALRGTKRDPLSFARIAAQLNAEGLPTRSGKSWQARTIAGILARETARPTR